jgi:hypothetical protein
VYVRFVWVRVSVELCRDDAGGHCQNGDLLGGANGIHFLISELDLFSVDVVDQLVAVHEVYANNVVVQLIDDIHQMGELQPFDIEIYFIDPDGIHCVSRGGYAALSIGNFLRFLVSKCGVEGSAVHASDGCSCVE